MVWIAPMTFFDGDVLTAAQLNNMILENFSATANGIATTEARIMSTAGKNAVTAQQWARAYAPEEITCSGQFPSDPDDDAVEGPTLTFQHNGRFWILFDCRITKSSGGSQGQNCAPVIVSGPGQDVMPSVYAIGIRSGMGGVTNRDGSDVVIETEPGITTVQLKYGHTTGVSASTGTYAQRRLTVIPF